MQTMKDGNGNKFGIGAKLVRQDKNGQPISSQTVTCIDIENGEAILEGVVGMGCKFGIGTEYSETVFKGEGTRWRKFRINQDSLNISYWVMA